MSPIPSPHAGRGFLGVGTSPPHPLKSVKDTFSTVCIPSRKREGILSCENFAKYPKKWPKSIDKKNECDTI